MMNYFTVRQKNNAMVITLFYFVIFYYYFFRWNLCFVNYTCAADLNDTGTSNTVYVSYSINLILALYIQSYN